MKILVLNAGSSSQKSGLYDLPTEVLPDTPPEPIWQASVDWTLHPGRAVVTIETARGKVEQELQTTSRVAVIGYLLDSLHQGDTQVIATLAAIDSVGHRIVHGGSQTQSQPITPDVKQAIADLSVLAPNHNPAHLEGIEAIEQLLPNLPQIAVFDTAFHTTLSPPAFTYPIPYGLTQQGIRRYGFHGISHQYCAGRAAEILDRPLADLKLITCHLGNGCSLAAIQQGQSIDTTMGFTPLDGLMMGTRSGAIDPGILLHLQRQHHYTGEELDTLLNQESGLKGVSGLSADLRAVTEAMATNPQAQLAFDLFIHRLRSSIGSLLASLQGVDVLVFTAGIGENSAIVREQACAGFEFLGLHLDRDKNQQRPVDQDIATANSSVRVLVIHTEEDWAIARECWRLRAAGDRFDSNGADALKSE
jgi:acetate kinase